MPFSFQFAYFLEKIKQLEAQLNKPKQEEIKYPQNCKYPDNAITPPTYPDGKKGIEGFCYYQVPSVGNEKKGEISGMYIPEDSPIIFWDFKRVSDALDYMYTENNWEKIGISKEFLLRL